VRASASPVEPRVDGQEIWLGRGHIER
jgi:hypothetical protein